MKVGIIQEVKDDDDEGDDSSNDKKASKGSKSSKDTEASSSSNDTEASNSSNETDSEDWMNPPDGIDDDASSTDEEGKKSTKKDETGDDEKSEGKKSTEKDETGDDEKSEGKDKERGDEDSQSWRWSDDDFLKDDFSFLHNLKQIVYPKHQQQGHGGASLLQSSEKAVTKKNSHAVAERAAGPLAVVREGGELVATPSRLVHDDLHKVLAGSV